VRLVTYDAGAGPRVGALEDHTVVDIGFDGDMVAFIAAGAPVGNRTPVDGARLLAPLRPRTLRDFLAFEGHLQNVLPRLGRPIPDEWYETPAYYKGMPDTVIGPDEEIPWPPYTEELDYELEVAAILGGRGRDLDEARAGELVFGYTLMNDWSARDIQRKEMSMRLGPAKAKDFATSLGPCIVTADELDPSTLEMTATVDGERWSRGTLAEARWTFPQMIAHVSRGEDVWPGDVYGSGTFGGGCGLDVGRFLWPGAVVELEAQPIGVLRNRVGTR
jgi:2-keto-4-pentenoate hydratase/2-oxohepta-3-ene-1,7-dioic acid hydratase in catechol pathway